MPDAMISGRTRDRRLPSVSFPIHLLEFDRKIGSVGLGVLTELLQRTLRAMG
jgi:hypothetical protein